MNTKKDFRTFFSGFIDKLEILSFNVTQSADLLTPKQT